MLLNLHVNKYPLNLIDIIIIIIIIIISSSSSSSSSNSSSSSSSSNVYPITYHEGTKGE